MLTCFHVGFTYKLNCQAVVGLYEQQSKTHAFLLPAREKDKKLKTQLLIH